MKRWLFVLALILILFSDHKHSKRYTTTFWGPFDSMITISASAYSQQQFDFLTDIAISRFTELSRYYDRFSTPGTIVNIAVLNQMAGKGAVPVGKEVFELLKFGQMGAARTENLVSPTFGSVTELWRKRIKEAEKGEGTPPEEEALKQAAKSISPELMELDALNHTVSLHSPEVVLDIGAFAKGYATEIVGKELVSSGLSRLAISSGGNIRVFSPPQGKTGWLIGIQNPNEAIMGHSRSIETLLTHNLAVATSGDYQRYFIHEGVRYHHLISPQTLYPASYYRSVTVACYDAGMADLFSTALFLVEWEKSVQLAEKEGLAVLWIMPDGEIRINSQMEKLLKKE